MNRKPLPPAVSYEEGLIERFKDPQFAVVYLNTILEDTDSGMKERFLKAMSLLAKAHGISELARHTRLQRESLRKALSERGNPRLSTLLSLLGAFGIQLRLEPLGSRAMKAPTRGQSDESSVVSQILAAYKETNDRLSRIEAFIAGVHPIAPHAFLRGADGSGVFINENPYGISASAVANVTVPSGRTDAH